MLKKLVEKIKQGGYLGASIGFVIALLLSIFGFFKTLFILIMTLVGYFIELRFFSSKEEIKKLLDKLLPPGFFR